MILGMKNGKIPPKLMDRFNSQIKANSRLHAKKHYISVDEVLPEELINKIDKKYTILRRVLSSPSRATACYNSVSPYRISKIARHYSGMKTRARYAVKEKLYP